MVHHITLTGYTAQAGASLMLGTSDSYGIEQLQITAAEGWEGLTVTATFHPPAGEPVRLLVPMDGLLDVPPEATKSGGRLAHGRIVFAGTADGVQRISCNVSYCLMPHAEIDGSESTATPSMDAQVLAEVAKVRATLENEVDEAEQAAAQSAAAAAASAEQAAQAETAAETAKTAAEAAKNEANLAAQNAGNSASVSKKFSEQSYDWSANSFKHWQESSLEALSAKLSAEEAKRAAASVMGVADLAAAEGEPGHVLNRTHWVADGMVEVPIEGQWIEEEPGSWVFMKTAPIGLDVGKTYTVCWDGVEYECVAQQIEMSNDAGTACCVLGDAALLTTGEATAGAPPFALMELPEVIVAEIGAYVMATGTDSARHDFTIHTIGEIVHKLDNKYLDLDWLPTMGDPVKGQILFDAPSHAGGLVLSTKATMTNGWRDYLCPETADWLCLVVDGEEYFGAPTISHPDANTVQYALSTNGCTLAISLQATNTTDDFILVTFTDGGTHDVACYVAQVEYNKHPEGYLPTTVPVIKNATAGQAVTVAEVDDDGKPTKWKAVDFPAGGGSGGDYIPTPATAEVGQTIVVKAVDSNGKPTEWECADMASGGGETGLELVGEWITTEEVASFTATLDDPLEESFFLFFQFVGTATNTEKYKPVVYVNGTAYRYLSATALYNNTCSTLWFCGEIRSDLFFRFERSVSGFHYDVNGNTDFLAHQFMTNAAVDLRSFPHATEKVPVTRIGIGGNGGTLGVGSGIRVYKIKGV